MNLGDVVRNKISGTYGTVHYSSFGRSVHVWKHDDEYGWVLAKTLGATVSELSEYWEVVELPEGWEKAPHGGLRRKGDANGNLAY